MIKMFVLDVDGTLTDGGFYLDGSGNEYKKFNVQDGYGLVSLLKSGIKVVFLSGRYSPATEARAKELKITKCINGASDKISVLKSLADEFGITREEIVYMGDDIPDKECIVWAKVGVSPSNGVPCIKELADITTSLPGGSGAVRECCDYILKYNGE